MIKLSGTQDSPFDQGFINNIGYVFCKSKYLNEKEKFIKWMDLVKKEKEEV